MPTKQEKVQHAQLFDRVPGVEATYSESQHDNLGIELTNR